jgi:elongation factor Ts
MTNLDLIKKLRETTGCGIADCNKAIKECGEANYDECVTWLRKKGLAQVAKKSGRVTSEGLIGLYKEGNKASMIELNSETDFVAKNDKFQSLVKTIVKTAINVDSKLSGNEYIEKLKDSNLKSGQKISDLLAENIGVIGENLNLRRGTTVELQGTGKIVSYLHNAVDSELGKIGVLAVLKSDADETKLQEIGKKIAMHIAAIKPEFLKIEEVSQEKLNKEKEILFEQARQSGKPDDIIEKMMVGKIRKYYEQVVLLEQAFVMDDKKKISDVLKEFEKETGKSVEIQQYALLVLGEGIEKKEENFAEEVAKMSK